MSKKNNSFLKIFLLTGIPVAIALFVYVIVLQEIKSLNKEKTKRQEELIEKINKANMRMVEVQRLTAENRVTKIAKEELSLIRKGEEFDRLRIDSYKAAQIEKIVNDKYE